MKSMTKIQYNSFITKLNALLKINAKLKWLSIKQQLIHREEKLVTLGLVNQHYKIVFENNV